MGKPFGSAWTRASDSYLPVPVGAFRRSVHEGGHTAWYRARCGAMAGATGTLRLSVSPDSGMKKAPSQTASSSALRPVRSFPKANATGCEKSMLSSATGCESFGGSGCGVDGGGTSFAQSWEGLLSGHAGNGAASLRRFVLEAFPRVPVVGTFHFYDPRAFTHARSPDARREWDVRRGAARVDAIFGAVRRAVPSLPFYIGEFGLDVSGAQDQHSGGNATADADVALDWLTNIAGSGGAPQRATDAPSKPLLLSGSGVWTAMVYMPYQSDDPPGAPCAFTMCACSRWAWG